MARALCPAAWIARSSSGCVFPLQTCSSLLADDTIFVTASCPGFSSSWDARSLAAPGDFSTSIRRCIPGAIPDTMSLVLLPPLRARPVHPARGLYIRQNGFLNIVIARRKPLCCDCCSLDICSTHFRRRRRLRERACYVIHALHIPPRVGSRLFVAAACSRQDNDGSLRDAWPLAPIRICDLTVSPDGNRLVAVGLLRLTESATGSNSSLPLGAAGANGHGNAATPPAVPKRKIVIYDLKTRQELKCVPDASPRAAAPQMPRADRDGFALQCVRGHG